MLVCTVSSADGARNFGLSFFDKAKKAMSMRKTTKGTPLLDVLGVSDELIDSTLDSITGHHIGFGSLKFRNGGVSGNYAASVDGIDIG